MKADEFAKSKAMIFLDVWEVDLFHRKTIEQKWQRQRKLILNNSTLTEKIRKGLADSFFQTYIPSDKLIGLAERAKVLENINETFKIKCKSGHTTPQKNCDDCKELLYDIVDGKI